MPNQETYGPLMKPSAFKALPPDQKRDRLKEFYGSAWRDRCSPGSGGHACQNPQEHQASYDHMETEFAKHKESGTPGSFLQRPDIAKALRTHKEHSAPDFEGEATAIGGPLSDYHGYTNGKRNPNPWPAR